MASSVATRNKFIEDGYSSGEPLSGGQLDTAVRNAEFDLRKITRCMGVPPKYNMDIDIQYTNDIAPGYGRVYQKTILKSPTIISICPGRVTMLPNFNKKEKDVTIRYLLEAVQGNSELYKTAVGDKGDGGWTAKLFDFEPNTAEYANYLNVLCRASAILMGLGEELMPGTSTKLKHFDYAYWKVRSTFQNTDNQKLNSIFARFWGNLNVSARGSIEDSNYVHFFVNNQETNISESIRTETSEANLLPDAAKSLGEVSANLAYYLSGNHTGFFGADDLEAQMQGLISKISNGNETFSAIGNGLLQGGQMVFPDMVSGATYSKEIRCSMDFISPYGDPLSIFLNCNVPANHLLAFALPKQLSDNVYTFPFVVRVYQQGNFNAQLAVISSIEINRGGDDGSAWTVDGLSTAWNVSITVTPLYSKLMMTSAEHPLLFLRNEGMLEYLGNLCGLDLKIHNSGVKYKLAGTFAYLKFFDIPSTSSRTIGDNIAAKLSPWVKFVS